MIQVSLTVGSRFPVNRKKIRQAAINLLTQYKVEHVRVDISIVGIRKITQLNE